jgi:DNA repair protein RecN (Recombination protein N)
VDLHGQHEHQLLLQTSNQTEFFDGWAGLAEERRALGRERSSLLEERRRLLEERAAWERDRLDEERVREDLAELTQAGLEEGEEESLKQERERLRHRERIVESLRAARQTLAAEEGGIEGPVRRAAKTLRTLAATVPDQAPLADQAEALLDSVRLMAVALEDAEARALEDPLPLEEIEARLDLIHRLGRKHRTNHEGLITLRDALEIRVRAMDPDRARDFDARKAALAKRDAEYSAALERLIEKRAKEAPRFAREVGSRLKRLGFSKAALAVRPAESEGRDRPLVDPVPIPDVELLFTPNAGEPARPLRRIASGGELSRVMLAIKSLMAERDRVAVLVFDEVDQGIGGAVGEEVGKMLRAIATSRQVLCITHLPLIAAHGTRHFRVAKATARGRTTTGVHTLAGDEREDEIARLLAGARVTATTRRQARELLDTARVA